MNGHRITGLPTTPLSSGEPITKGFVEKYYVDYKNIITFKVPINPKFFLMILIEHKKLY